MLITVCCSGIPKNIDGIKEIIRCTGNKAIIRNASCSLSKPNEEKIEIIVLECKPGIKPDMMPRKIPRRKNRRDINIIAMSNEQWTTKCSISQDV